MPPVWRCTALASSPNGRVSGPSVPFAVVCPRRDQDGGHLSLGGDSPEVIGVLPRDMVALASSHLTGTGLMIEENKGKVKDDVGRTSDEPQRHGPILDISPANSGEVVSPQSEVGKWGIICASRGCIREGADFCRKYREITLARWLEVEPLESTYCMPGCQETVHTQYG